jgi:hypothetical protein
LYLASADTGAISASSSSSSSSPSPTGKRRRGQVRVRSDPAGGEGDLSRSLARSACVCPPPCLSRSRVLRSPFPFRWSFASEIGARRLLALSRRRRPDRRANGTKAFCFVSFLKNKKWYSPE